MACVPPDTNCVYRCNANNNLHAVAALATLTFHFKARQWQKYVMFVGVARSSVIVLVMPTT